MGLAADKAAVRDYLAYKDAQIRAPELFAVGAGRDALAAADLPERFVLKSTSGWAQNRFVACPCAMRGSVSATPSPSGTSGTTGASSGSSTTAAFQALARGGGDRDPARITEYKFYCIMGEPQFFMYMTDRTGNDVRCSLFDLQWRPTPFHWSGYPAHRRTAGEAARRLREDARRGPAPLRGLHARPRRLPRMRRAGLLLGADLRRAAGRATPSCRGSRTRSSPR